MLFSTLPSPRVLDEYDCYPSIDKYVYEYTHVYRAAVPTRICVFARRACLYAYHICNSPAPCIALARTWHNACDFNAGLS